MLNTVVKVQNENKWISGLIWWKHVHEKGPLGGISVLYSSCHKGIALLKYSEGICDPDRPPPLNLTTVAYHDKWLLYIVQQAHYTTETLRTLQFYRRTVLA